MVEVLPHTRKNQKSIRLFIVLTNFKFKIGEYFWLEVE